MGRPLTLILMGATFCGGLLGGLPALAQDVADDEPDQRPNIAPAPIRPAHGLHFSDRQIDRWLFGLDGDVDSARLLSESRLKSRIGYIDQLCILTPDQRKKLELAGRGDIKRFFDQVAERKKAFYHEKSRDEVLQSVELARLLGQAYRSGIFSDASMFAKVLGAILDPAQLIRYRRDGNGSRLTRYQARLEWVALTLQKGLSLSDGQRIRLLCILLEETRPPRRFGPIDYYGIMVQASRIPEGRLKPIFSVREWDGFQKEIDEARRREGELRESGYLPEEDDQPDRETARQIRTGLIRGLRTTHPQQRITD